MGKITLNGIKIEYIQKRSSRRSISAFVNNDGVLEVRTPYKVDDTYVREFISENASKIFRIIENAKARREYELSLDEEELHRLRKKAESVIPERVRHYSKIMGVNPERIRINNAKTRFGSCSSKGNLNFSCRLMAYSSKAVDYVVVHELSHLIHMDHSVQFWYTVEKYMPDYKTVRQELKKIPSSVKGGEKNE